MVCYIASKGNLENRLSKQGQTLRDLWVGEFNWPMLGSMDTLRGVCPHSVVIREGDNGTTSVHKLCHRWLQTCIQWTVRTKGEGLKDGGSWSEGRGWEEGRMGRERGEREGREGSGMEGGSKKRFLWLAWLTYHVWQKWRPVLYAATAAAECSTKRNCSGRDGTQQIMETFLTPALSFQFQWSYICVQCVLLQTPPLTFWEALLVSWGSKKYENSETRVPSWENNSSIRWR